MPSTAKTLYGPAQLSSSAATVYTVPALTLAKLSFIHVQNPTATARKFTLSIGADAAGTRVYDAITIPANTDAATGGIRDFFVDYPLSAATVVQAYSDSASVLVLFLSGEEYTLG